MLLGHLLLAAAQLVSVEASDQPISWMRSLGVWLPNPDDDKPVRVLADGGEADRASAVQFVQSSAPEIRDAVYAAAADRLRTGAQTGPVLVEW